MKFCPTCNSTFTGAETFCPKDGTRLEEPRKGELVGASLGNAVKLETLQFTDVMAERYLGRILEGKRPCYVTVFNRRFTPSQNAPRLVETARAKVGTPVPKQLSTLLQVRFDHFPAFVIETAPRGPSLRSLLEARGKLDWREAARIASNVARIIEWLNGQGVTHHGLHPGSIFVTDLAKGQVQLGEWYSEDAQWVDNPLQTLSTTPDRFVGYVAYMAPELAYQARSADLRSAVYSLGVLLFELIVGAPPFAGGTPAEVLRAQLADLPPKVSAASGVSDIPGDLDQIVEMMLSKAPDARFQAPAAIIGALASILGEEPSILAPAIERDEEQEENDHYATIEMSSVDRDSIPGLSDTLALMGRGSETIQSPVALNQSKGESEDEERGPMRTLMMGNVSEIFKQDDEQPSEEANPESGEAPAAQWIRKGSSAEVQSVPKESVSEEKDAEETPTKASKPLPQESGMTLKMTPVDETGERVAEPSNAEEVEEEPVAQPEEVEPQPETAKMEVAKVEVDPALVEEPEPEPAKEPEPEPAKEPEPEPAKEPEPESEPEPVKESVKDQVKPLKNEGFEIGSLAVKQPETVTDDWFSRSTEQAWDESVAEEIAEQAEKSNRFAVTAVIITMLLVAVGFWVWVNYFAASDEVDEKPEEPPVTEVKTVDLAEIKDRFDRGIKEGRVIRPISNSAMSALNELKRHGPESETYENARKEFVNLTRTDGEKAYKEGNLALAQALVGYSSEFDPEDAELRALAEKYHSEYLQAQENPENPPAEEPVEAVEAPVVEPEETKAPEPKNESKPAEKKTTQPEKTEPAPAVDNSKLLSEAKSAYSRGDLNRAQELYKTLLASDGNNHQVHAGLGQVYFDRALYNDAVKHQRQALTLKPGRTDYQINLGQSYYRLGRFQDAINVWEEVLKREPNNKNAKQYIELAKRRLN